MSEEEDRKSMQDEHDAKSKKKKRHKKSRQNLNITNETKTDKCDDSDSEMIPVKKKKDKKMKDMEDDKKQRKANKETNCDENTKETREKEGNSSKKKKKEKRKVDDNSDSDERDSHKKKKKKHREHDIEQEDIKTKQGNEDGLAKNEEQSNADVGQWGNAAFESANQKQKFIRLLGGFKKGNTGSNLKSQQPVGLHKFSSAAMNKTEEKKLNDKLETQYQQAFDTTRKRRGLGLGYAPEQDKDMKSFFIDKTASTSTKFD